MEFKFKYDTFKEAMDVLDLLKERLNEKGYLLLQDLCLLKIADEGLEDAGWRSLEGSKIIKSKTPFRRGYYLCLPMETINFFLGCQIRNEERLKEFNKKNNVGG